MRIAGYLLLGLLVFFGIAGAIILRANPPPTPLSRNWPEDRLLVEFTSITFDGQFDKALRGTPLNISEDDFGALAYKTCNDIFRKAPRFNGVAITRLVPEASFKAHPLNVGITFLVRNKRTQTGSSASEFEVTYRISREKFVWGRTGTTGFWGVDPSHDDEVVAGDEYPATIVGFAMPNQREQQIAVLTHFLAESCTALATDMKPDLNAARVDESQALKSTGLK